MKSTFALVAAGASFIPRLDICLYARDADEAKSQAKKMALALSPNYYRFDVYDVRGDHKHVMAFTTRTDVTVVETK